MSGTIPSAYNRILRDVFAMVRAAIMPTLTYCGTYRYRVVKQAADCRLMLQALDPKLKLPDLPVVSIRAGIAGYSTKLKIGAIVRVQFDDHSPTLPVVVGFGIDDTEGRLPEWQQFDGADVVEIGPSSNLVELGNGSESMTIADDPTGRVLRYGDHIMVPVGPTAILTDWVLLPPFTAVVPVSPIDVAKVSA